MNGERGLFFTLQTPFGQKKTLALPAGSRESKINAAAILFPVAESRWLSALAAANLQHGRGIVTGPGRPCKPGWGGSINRRQQILHYRFGFRFYGLRAWLAHPGKTTDSIAHNQAANDLIGYNEPKCSTTPHEFGVSPPAQP
jgi:hypothetical protein